MEFRAWPKIPRWNRAITITEKIDGTNACVIVTEDGEVGAQSRKRIITPDDDNFGFAAWVDEFAGDLLQLGPGYHYGEWYGRGIQRGYGLTERRFALFNVSRWLYVNTPECVRVVPVIVYATNTADHHIKYAVDFLREKGSLVSPGYMKPEGIVIHHHASRQNFKVLLENDDVRKGE